MKKTFLSLCLIFSFCSIYAVEFSLSSGYSLLNGKINEFVFDSTCPNTDNQLSKLEWPIQNISLLNIQSTFLFTNNLFLDIKYSSAFSKASGIMKDSDWLNQAGTGENPYERTNYSEHNNKLSFYNSICFDFGQKIAISDNFSLSPFAEYSFNLIKFESTDGYTKYKSNDYNINYLKGQIIDYEQFVNTIFLGLSSAFSKNNFSFYIDAAFSPCLSFCDAYDIHYKRYSIFNDFMVFALNSRASAKMQWTFSNNIISLDASISYMPKSKGKTYTSYYDEEFSFSDYSWLLVSSKGGSSRFLYSFGINYKYCFNL